METPILLDAVGVRLAPGQRVLYSPAFGTGALQPGTIIRVGRRPHPFGPRDHVVIRRDDGKTIVIGWARRIVVMQQEDNADGWLRRQLATLGERS
jgi:hypothetical protein